MKYVIVIPDGCADDPQESLGGKTPLQAARLPNMDRIAQMGCVGRADNVPRPLTPASDVATLSLFGYDPLVVYTGRSPLEAVAMGIKLGSNDWAVRCNVVTVEDGLMRDFTAGHITTEEAREVIEALAPIFRASYPFLELYPGVQYRHALVCRDCDLMFSAQTKTQPPHDIPDRPIEDHLPKGPGAELFRTLMKMSQPVLANHPVNRARVAAGKRPATQVWLWGQGKAPSLKPFAEVYGKRGAIISAVDLVRGTGMLVGWARVDAPGATGYLDTDYASKGRTGVAALKDHDLVCVHIEAPDEASHEGKAGEKVLALERIDEHIVGPLLAALQTYGQWRVLVSPDHRTTLATRAHAYGMVPFAMAGSGIEARGQTSYDEATAALSEVEFVRGHELMRTFLGR